MKNPTLRRKRQCLIPTYDPYKPIVFNPNPRILKMDVCIPFDKMDSGRRLDGMAHLTGLQRESGVFELFLHFTPAEETTAQTPFVSVYINACIHSVEIRYSSLEFDVGIKRTLTDHRVS